MADNKRIYSISINGVKQSISEIDALIARLNDLEKRMSSMSSKNIKISSKSSSSSLEGDEKLLREIYATEQKIQQVRSEEYQSLLANKELLKEATEDAKQRAASERLASESYSNTMAGMKQQLADIKRIINTTDISDEVFGDMVQKANELNSKLKEIESSYGQYGRNVGNYANDIKAALSSSPETNKLIIQVNGVAREFDNARQALKQLKNERDTLKLMGQDVGDLDNVVKKLTSDIRDMSKSSASMDNLLDTFEGFIAVANASKGLSALFGMDDKEIQKSIQKLVALQSALQGLEKIRLQMQTGEGLGKILSKGNNMIDSFISRITTAELTTEGLAMSSKGATVAVRGLSLALKSIGVGFIIAGITAVISMLSRIAERANYAESKMNSFEMSIKSLDKELQNNRDKLSSDYLKGYISDNEYLTRQYQIQNDAISKRISLLRELAQSSVRANSSFLGTYDNRNVEFSGKGLTGDTTVSVNSFFPWIKGLETSVKTMDEVETKWKLLDDAVKEGSDAFDKYGKGLSGWFKSLFITVKDTEEVVKGLGNIRLSDFINQFDSISRQFRSGVINSEEYAEALRRLTREMDSNEVVKSVIANLDKYIPDEKVREQVNNILNEIRRLDDAFNMTSEEQVHHWNQVRIDGMKEGWAKTKAQIEEEKRYELEQNGHTQEQITLINEKYRRREIEAAKQYNQEALAVDNELARLRISNMENSLKKQLMLIEQERKERIQNARRGERRVGELTLEINKQYDKKILDEKREWAYNVQKVYTDMWSRVYSVNNQNANREFDNQLMQLQEHLEKYKELASSADVLIPTSAMGYRQNQVVNEEYDAFGNRIGKKTYSDENYRIAEEYLHLLERIDLIKTRISEVQMFGKTDLGEEKAIETLRRLDDMLNKANDDLNYFLDSYAMSAEEFNEMSEVMELRNNNFTTNLSVQFKTRESAMRVYYNSIARLSNEYVQNTLEVEKARLEEAMNNELRALKNSYNAEDKELEDHYRNGELTTEQYNEISQRLLIERTENEASIFENYLARRTELERKARKDEMVNNAMTHSSMIEEYRRFYDNLSSQDTQILTKLGFINVPKTIARNKELKASYSELSSSLSNEFTKLKKAFEMNDIDLETYERLKAELNSLLTIVNSSLLKIREEGKNLISSVASDINTYVQAVGQSMNTILSSISEIQSNNYDRQIEEMDKFIEQYEEKLNELSDAIKEHSDNVNSIEDELSNARGDRRQMLIDQLNAEKAAQREALAEEKRVQKEKEKAEERQKKLEIEQAKAKKKMQIAQATINMAMAISMAAVNSWPMPAIAMMALAGAAGAAQIAAIQSTNIPSYGKGGLLQGPSHSQGGIKVLGGAAEVEGDEFVTNKVTTQKNVDLMYYINSKKKKLSLEDFIDFYSDSKVSKNVSNVGRRYANGGVLPSVQNTMSINDRLYDTMVAFANRPVVVSVADIIDRTEDVTTVRVLAGLEP